MDMLNVTYKVSLTDKGKMLIDDWKSGDRARVERALSGPG
jgi:hypothetical protein